VSIDLGGSFGRSEPALTLSGAMTEHLDSPDGQQTHIEIAGKSLARVRYGREAEDWGADRVPIRGSCHDCGVAKGEVHIWGCDVERCPACGGQVIYCDCEDQAHGER
jgi:hypothetical protein